MKTVHCFKPDFKYQKLIKKEWLDLSELNNFFDSEFYIISFRTVEKMKVVNYSKEALMGHFNLTKENIVSETFLDEDPFLVPDGQFILTKIKRKELETIENKTKESKQNDPNFFFIRDVINLVNKYYFNFDHEKK